MRLFGKKNRHNDRILHMVDDSAPFAYVEAYKALRTNIDFLATTNGYKTFMVTSSGPNEGKTSVTINLAMTMAEGGKKVILVDCDLRKGTVASYLKYNRNTQGIAHVLGKQKILEETIIHDEATGMDILTTGSVLANASEAVGSVAMMDIIQKLSERYDYVFIDTPPVSVVTDAAIISRYTDGVLIVARSEETTKQSLGQSKRILEDVNANIVGVVLNDYNSKKRLFGKEYYQYYNYGYGYGYGYSNDKKTKKKKK